MRVRSRTKTFRIAALMAALGVLLATTWAGSAGAAAPSAKKIDESGVLKIGARITESSERPVFDPTKGVSAGATSFYWYVYDTLLVRQINGKYRPALALSADIVDPSSIRVKLRPGVKFQDGTTVDAEAVKFTIQRNVDSRSSQFQALRQDLLSLVSSVDVVSPTELTIRLSKPQAGAFYDLLAGAETTPLSPTAVRAGKDMNKEPTGAGPFKLVSQDDSVVRLSKWSGYWNAENVHLAGIEIVNTASPEAMVNGLTAGATDFQLFLQPSSFQQLNSQNLVLRTKPFPGSVPRYDFVMFNCVGNPGLLGDPRVRRALAYATDRDAINKVVYQGRAQLMSQWAGEGSKNYDPKLENFYEYNVKKAKKLLAEAGKAGMTITFNNPAANPTAAQMAEILQQQWAKAGVKVELITTANISQDFFLSGRIAALASPAQGHFDQFGTWFGPQGRCKPDAPEFTAMLTDLYGAEPGSPEAVKAWRATDAYVLENAHYVPLFRSPDGIAWNKRLGKMTIRQDRNGNYAPDFTGTYVARGRN